MPIIWQRCAWLFSDALQNAYDSCSFLLKIIRVIRRECVMRNSFDFTCILAGAFCLFLAPASAQVVALGGSNTAGKGVGASESYPAQLQSMLQARGSNLRVINAGVSGDTTSRMLARLSSDVPEGTRIVILQFGGNDFKRKNSGELHEENTAEIRKILRGRGIRMIDAQPAIRSIRSAGFVQPDQTHLTAEGYRRVAAQLLPSLR
jgi:acyl-CoA thioesterase-1